jgi:SAM-dependent methyltransferase
MRDCCDVRWIDRHWGRADLDRAILDALAAAGIQPDALTVETLAPVDQFHGGGKAATDRLARLAGFRRGTHVLDAGGGLGGPARTLAVELGCRVTVVDLTESYVQAGARLTARLGLGGLVTHHRADALDLPFRDHVFDAVWTQNSGMNIADKVRLYAEFARVVRPGGRLVLQEPMAGPVQPLIFPVMWARDAAASFLRRPSDMRALIEAAGFRTVSWDDVTAEFAPAPAAVPAHSIQRLVMADTLAAVLGAQQRNREEGRVVVVQAVFDRLDRVPETAP